MIASPELPQSQRGCRRQSTSHDCLATHKLSAVQVIHVTYPFVLLHAATVPRCVYTPDHMAALLGMLSLNAWIGDSTSVAFVAHNLTIDTDPQIRSVAEIQCRHWYFTRGRGTGTWEKGQRDTS